MVEKLDMLDCGEEWTENLEIQCAITKRIIEEVIVRKINEIIEEINRINNLIGELAKDD